MDRKDQGKVQGVDGVGPGESVQNSNRPPGRRLGGINGRVESAWWTRALLRAPVWDGRESDEGARHMCKLRTVRRLAQVVAVAIVLGWAVPEAGAQEAGSGVVSSYRVSN